MTKQTYRPAVGVALFNRAGDVLICRRRNRRLREHVAEGYEWQMPQGGIDGDEDPYAACLRELYEETSVKSTELLGEAPDWYAYDLPEDIAREAWHGRYAGQTQKWFALRFLGDDSEINIETPGGGMHEAEFDAWRWERLARLPELIIPFKRPVYEKVVAAFAGFARPDR